MKKHTILFLSLNLFFLPLMAQVGSWTQKGDFSGTPRSYAISFSIGDYGYIGGGTISGGRTQDFWEYDSENDTWTQKANISGQGRFGAVGFAIGAKGYSGLGTTNGAGAGDFYEYDPENNEWSQVAPFPGTNAITPVTFVVNEKGYVATGASNSVIGNENKEVWEYDPQINAWSQKQDFPGAQRSRGMGFAFNGKGYLGCGYYYTDSDFIEHNDFWEYSPETDEWNQKANFSGSARSNGVGFSLGNYGFMGMGYDGNSTVNDLWRFNPETNDWSQMVFFEGQGRLAAASFVTNNRAFVGTGYYVVSPNFINLDDFWEYENDLLGITKEELNHKITVFPNPVQNVTTIKGNGVDILRYELYDINGKLLLFNSNNVIDMSTMYSGVYLLKIMTEAGSVTKRILKK